MLRQGVTRNYLPGVSSETSRDAGSCHEILLNGPPWSQNSSYNLVCLIVEHSRSVFGFLGFLHCYTKHVRTLVRNLNLVIVIKVPLPKEITLSGAFCISIVFLGVTLKILDVFFINCKR